MLGIIRTSTNQPGTLSVTQPAVSKHCKGPQGTDANQEKVINWPHCFLIQWLLSNGTQRIFTGCSASVPCAAYLSLSW